MDRIFKAGEYSSMVAFLIAYQRAGDMRRWDEFRNKIPPDMLTSWGDVLTECKRNGFVRPTAYNGEIVWYQIMDNGHERNGDLCTLCDRDCKRRELIDSGDFKWIKDFRQNPPCWKGERNG